MNEENKEQVLPELASVNPAEQEESQEQEKKPKKKFSFWQFLKGVVVTCLVGFLLLLGGAYGVLRFVTRDVKASAFDRTHEEGAKQSAAIKNILIIGIDERGDITNGRSDVNMIFSINYVTGKLMLTSILRDTYVEIPGYPDNRINAAYEKGGAALLSKTIEKNFGIPIHEYVCLSFEDVVRIVDTLGHITLRIEENEIQYMNLYINEYNILHNRAKEQDFIQKAGALQLNGVQALAYARIRYTATSDGEWGDFGRTKRQRTVIMAIYNRMKEAGLKPAIKAVSAVFSGVDTSLSSRKISLLGMSMLPYLPSVKAMEQLEIPLQGTWENYVAPTGADMLRITNWEQNREAIGKLYP